MRTLLRHIAIVLAVGLVTLLTNLGGPRLWDRDEPRNAGCAEEMLARGDWVTPYFNGELRTHKPALLYWLMMASYAVFGSGEFAARFVSVACGIGTAVCVYLLGRRLFNARAGLWAAVALLTALMFDVAARAATPDSLLVFLITLAITIFVLRVRWNWSAPAGPLPEDRPGLAWGDWAVIYAVMGLAVLAKGPAGMLLPGAALFVFLLLARTPQPPVEPRPLLPWPRLRWIEDLLRPLAPANLVGTVAAMRWDLALAAVLLVAGPWYLWVAIRTDGEWVHEFFWVHNVQRATEPLERHSGPFWYYLPAILLGFFPWSVFAVPLGIDAAGRIEMRDRGRWPLTLLVVWVAVVVGLFSAASTKLPSYVTPCYPALALLVGHFVDRWIQRREASGAFWNGAAFVALAASGVAVLVALPLSLRFAIPGRLPGEEALGLLGLVPLTAGGVAWFLSHAERRFEAAWTCAVGAICLVTLLFGFAALRVDRHQRLGELIAAVNTAEADEVAAFGVLESTWTYYLARPVRFFEEAEADDAAEFLERNGLLITDARRAQSIRKRARVEVLCRTPYFLRDSQLVLLRLARTRIAADVPPPPR